MALLYPYSIRHPRRVLGVAALITIAIAPGTLRLKLRTDGHALVPTDAPEIIVDQSIRDEFGVEDPIVVVIRSEHPDGVFNVHTLTLVDELTSAFGRIETVPHAQRPAVPDGPSTPRAPVLIGPDRVVSLATEHGDRVKPGTLIFRTFLSPLPTTPAALNRLRNDLREIALYIGTLLSYDEKSTAILVSVPEGVDRLGLYRALRDVIAAKGPLPERIDVIGAPVAEALLGTHILEDLGVPSKLLGHRTFHRDAPDDRTWTQRIPRSVYELRVLIGRSIGLVPVALTIMAIVFVVSFKSLPAALLPLSEVGACLIVVFGLMGFCGVPIYLTIAVLPVILTAVGVADEIHIFRRYTEELRAHPAADHIDALRTAMSEMAPPVVKTSVTTAVGFLSFALSPIGPVRAFGVFTSIGILFCMVWSLTVIPALLALIKPGWFVGRPARERAAQGARQPVFARLAGCVIRRRRIVLAIAVVAAAVSALGARRIMVQDSWIDGFAPGSDFYQATGYFNEQFVGTHNLLVCVDTGHHTLRATLTNIDIDHRLLRLPADLTPDPETLVGQRIRLRLDSDAGAGLKPARRHRRREEWDSRVERVTMEGDSMVVHTYRRDGSPLFALRLSDKETATCEITPRRLLRTETLERIGEIEGFLEAQTEFAVGGVIGPADYMETTRFLARARAEGTRSIPPSTDRIEWLWGQYGRIRGEQKLRQVVNANFSRGLITVFLKDANFVATGHLMDNLRAYEEATLRQNGMSLSLAGDVAVSQTLIRAIVRTQITSLLGSLIGILMITALLGRSLQWGGYSLLPCALAVLINFAVMGWVSMPLGVATSMFAGMTLGIGVDYAIHLLERYRLARARGLDLDAALIDAVSATGPAVFIDALAVALGFGILTLSRVPANARLGGLVVLSIVNCLIATLVLLPALVRAVESRRSSEAPLPSSPHALHVGPTFQSVKRQAGKPVPHAGPE